MQPNPNCPVCDSCGWETVNTHRYTAGDEAARNDGDLADYFALRLRVLFEVWFPGAEQVELRSVQCDGCGFMTYLPRPSTQDIEAKYRFLQIHEKSIGGQSTDPRAIQGDRRRSKRIYKEVERCLSAGERRRRLRILDYGGGDGKLLRSFVTNGHRCCLVDYNQAPRAGIERLGDTLDDLDTSASFDVILCSHVLEHLADPSSVIVHLASRLTSNGVLYSEVPFEIWKGIPIDRDPVTHVNFFNYHNFMALCQQADLGMVNAKKRMSTYDVWRIEVLAVLLKKGYPKIPVSLKKGIAQTRCLLSPSLKAILQRRLRFRQVPIISSVTQRGIQAISRFTNKTRITPS